MMEVTTERLDALRDYHGTIEIPKDHPYMIRIELPFGDDVAAQIYHELIDIEIKGDDNE